MRWFYSIRGDVTQHGLVDETELSEMARAGRLNRNDLVWAEGEGSRWIPAYTVPDLFPPAPPPPLEPKDAIPHPPLTVRVPERRTLALLKWAAMVLAIILLAAAAWFALR